MSDVLESLRRYFLRLRHRDAVMDTLTALLVLYPRGREFAQDFPALKPTIRADFQAGVSPPLSGLRLAGSIVENFIGQLQPKEKAGALMIIVTTGRAGFAALAAERISRRRGGTAKERARFTAHLAGAAIFIATRMAEEGSLRPEDQAALVARIEAALDPDGTEAHSLAEVFTP